MDQTNWFNDLKTKADMNSCAIGIIRVITEERNTAASAKLIEIASTLKDLEEAWNAKKAPALTEGPKKINHLDCTVNVTKVQSLLEPWYLERILRDGGGMK